MLRRRDFLAGSVGVGVGVFVSGCVRPAVPPADLESTIEWMIETPREDLAARAVAELDAGLSLATLRAANLAACLVYFPLRDGPNLGGPHHAVPAVDVGRQLGEEFPGGDATYGALIALDELKGSLESFRTRPGPPLPAVFDSIESSEALAALRDALETNDREVADAAAASLARAGELDAVFELIRLYAQRDNNFDTGHRIITAFHLSRLLPDLDAETIELAIRATARAVASPPGDRDELWEAARSSARTLASWEDGVVDEVQTEVLWNVLRGGDHDVAIERTLEHLNSFGARSAWDAVYLGAAEVILRSEVSQLFNTTHGITGALAAEHAYQQAADAETRLTNLLTIAGRVSASYAEVTGEFDLQARPGVAGASLEDIFVARETSALDAADAVIGFLGAGGTRDQLAERMRGNTMTRATNLHHLKFPEAVLRASVDRHSELQARLLAASMVFVPKDSEPISDAARRIDAAL
jgi:hypothetical protein